MFSTESLHKISRELAVHITSEVWDLETLREYASDHINENTYFVPGDKDQPLEDPILADLNTFFPNKIQRENFLRSHGVEESEITTYVNSIS